MLNEDGIRAFTQKRTIPVARAANGWILDVQEYSAANGYPEDLIAIFVWARQQSVHYVMLYRGGDLIEELTSYDW